MTFRHHTFNYYRRGTLARRGYLWKTLLFPGALFAVSLVYVGWLVLGNLIAPAAAAAPASAGTTVVGVAAFLTVVAAVYVVPSLTVGRLRSAGRSTWWALLVFVPYANLLLLIVLLFLPVRQDGLHPTPEADALSGGAEDDANVSAAALMQPARPADGMAIPELTQAEPVANTTSSKPIWVTVGSVAVFLIVVALARGGGQLLGQFIRSGVDGVTQANSAQSLLSDKQPKEYVSSEQGFRAVFPGFPSINRQTLALQGRNVPTVTYSASVDANRDVRFVYVWDYSAIPGADASIDIEGGLNGLVQGIQGARLVSSAPSTLSGVAAVEGHFTTPIQGQNLDSYARIAHLGAKMYGAASIGLAKNEFDDFAANFQLIP